MTLHYKAWALELKSLDLLSEKPPASHLVALSLSFLIQKVELMRTCETMDTQIPCTRQNPAQRLVFIDSFIQRLFLSSYTMPGPVLEINLNRKQNGDFICRWRGDTFRRGDRRGEHLVHNKTRCYNQDLGAQRQFNHLSSNEKGFSKKLTSV